MEQVTIKIEGQELETISITLTASEVEAIYKERKNLIKEKEDLEKKFKDLESRNNSNSDTISRLNCEINQADLTLTALGIQKELEEGYPREIKLSGRIALLVKNLLSN